jgi:hypothetical protein
MLQATEMASGPEILIMPMAPVPSGVAMAAMVWFSSTACIIFYTKIKPWADFY